VHCLVLLFVCFYVARVLCCGFEIFYCFNFILTCIVLLLLLLLLYFIVTFNIFIYSASCE